MHLDTIRKDFLLEMWCLHPACQRGTDIMEMLRVTKDNFKEYVLFCIRTIPAIVLYSQSPELAKTKHKTYNLYHITFINALSYFLKQYQPKTKKQTPQTQT